MSDNLIPPPEREFAETRLRLRKDQLLASIQADHGRRAFRPWMNRRRALVLALAVLATAGVAAAILPSGGGGP